MSASLFDAGVVNVLIATVTSALGGEYALAATVSSGVLCRGYADRRQARQSLWPQAGPSVGLYMRA
jgi:hypothetical protein